MHIALFLSRPNTGFNVCLAGDTFIRPETPSERFLDLFVKLTCLTPEAYGPKVVGV